MTCAAEMDSRGMKHEEYYEIASNIKVITATV
jgi:hypothetical protein